MRRRLEIAPRLMARLADLVVDHPWITFGLLLAMTVLAAVGQFNPEWVWRSKLLRAMTAPAPAAAPAPTAVPDSEETVPREREIPPPGVDPIRVAGGDVIVVARSDEFFTPSGVEAMRAVVASLESLDHVAEVFWIDRIPVLNLFGLPEPVYPRGDASAARFEAAKRRASEHPLVVGQLMSADARTLLLMVRIDWLFVEQDADCTDRLRQVAGAAAAEVHPEVDISFAVTGSVPIRLSRSANNRENVLRYQIIGNVTCLALALVLFRGLSAVIVVGLAPAAGVFWTIGVVRLLGMADNSFTPVILPVLICMIGFADGVHMLVHIRRHRVAGDSPAVASKAAVREVGLACWLTSLTTAIGFGSLMLARQEVVREFGLSCVIGVLLTFVSVVLIIPWASATRFGARIHSGHEGNWVDHNLRRVGGIIQWVLRRSRLMATIAIAITVVLAFGASRLSPDERLTSSLDPGSEAVAALQQIDEALGGMETARVAVSWDRNIASHSGQIATVVSEIEVALREEPLIGHPLSMVSLLSALPGEGSPESRMSLLELLPPSLKRAYFTPEHRTAEVQFRVRDLGIARYGPVFERLEERLASIQQEHPEFQIALAGNAIRRWKRLYQVVVDLAASLGTATVIIFAVLTLLFRSLRLGLISIIPNLFPLAATGSLMLVSGGHLEIVSVCAFTVCLGIAVDDTIHFMTRFNEERRRGKPRRLAISDAFVAVGTALIMTTIVLAVGFGTALLSDARDHRTFAMMGILTIVSALVADLLFLPALLDRFAPVIEDEEEG